MTGSKDTRLKSVIDAEKRKAKAAKQPSMWTAEGRAKWLGPERKLQAAVAREVPSLLKRVAQSFPGPFTDEEQLSESTLAEPEYTTLDAEPEQWKRPVPTSEVEVLPEEDDEPTPDVLSNRQLVRILPQQALAQRTQAQSDPVTTYLSRYVSRHSRLAIASSLNVVARYLTGQKVDPRTVPWTQVRYVHAQLVRTKLAADYAWASTNRHLLALRGVMKECWRLGLVEHDVYLRIAEVEPMKATEQEIGRALKAPELQALFAACDTSATGRRNAAILTLTSGAGMRRSEVCDFKVENWDKAEGQLKILGKGQKWRNVYLSPKRGEIIESWLDIRGRAPGFMIRPIDKAGAVIHSKALTATGLYVLLQRIGAAAKVKEFTPHDLRRTFITTLLERGVDALTVSKLAGHKNVQTTLGYDKRGEAAKKQAAVALLDD